MSDHAILLHGLARSIRFTSSGLMFENYVYRFWNAAGLEWQQQFWALCCRVNVDLTPRINGGQVLPRSLEGAKQQCSGACSLKTQVQWWTYHIDIVALQHCLFLTCVKNKKTKNKKNICFEILVFCLSCPSDTDQGHSRQCLSAWKEVNYFLFIHSFLQHLKTSRILIRRHVSCLESVQHIYFISLSDIYDIFMFAVEASFWLDMGCRRPRRCLLKCWFQLKPPPPISRHPTHFCLPLDHKALSNEEGDWRPYANWHRQVSTWTTAERNQRYLSLIYLKYNKNCLLATKQYLFFFSPPSQNAVATPSS